MAKTKTSASRFRRRLRSSFGWLDVTFWVAALTMAAALLLGGGTRQNMLSDGFLQLLAIPALLFACRSFASAGVPPHLRWTLAFAAILLLVPLVQLIPLPPQLAQSLFDHQLILSLESLVASPNVWWPMSVAPEATQQAALSLIVPLAVFLTCLRLDFAQRRALSLVVLGFAVLNGLIGLTQMSQGNSSPLRFYDITNGNEAVGFFANRNHLAAFLNVSLAIAVVWLLHSIDQFFAERPNARSEPSVFLPPIICGAVILVLLTAELMSRSRAGIIFAGLSILASMICAGSLKSSISQRVLMTIVVGAMVLSSQFALIRILDRLDEDPLKDARIVFAQRTLVAARAFLPFGSGVGTFGHVYGQFERPVDALLDTFANRAHNDFLEAFLEDGWAFVALALAFSGWVLRRSVLIWAGRLRNSSTLDRRLAAVSALGIVLIAGHSIVDYPLRTGGIMALFAMLCAFLCEPAVVAPQAISTGLNAKRKMRLAVDPPGEAQRGSRADSAAGGHPADTQWGQDIQWPAAWRNPPDTPDKS